MGERFPRWMIGLAGRRVPVRLATVPAGLVAIFITSASAGFLATGGVQRLIDGTLDAAAAPMLLWPFWGAALGAAAVAYHLRRRSGCVSCARHDGVAGVVPEPAAGAY